MRNLTHIPAGWESKMHRLIGKSINTHSVKRLQRIIDCMNSTRLSNAEREKLERLYAYCNLKFHLINLKTC